MGHDRDGERRAALRLLVSGRVQGVGYRVRCQDAARGLRLDGFVRNLADGRVEVVAVGARPAVDRLARWCERGPLGAAVTGVERVALDPGDEPVAGSGFVVARGGVRAR